MKKYEFTGETREINMQYDKFILHRIQAVTDFSDIKAGELGGWIEKEENLSHTGNAWVYDNAQIFGDAGVRGNARVRNNAKVHGNAWVYGNAVVRDNAQVHGNVWVYGNAIVRNNAIVYDDNAIAYSNVSASDNAKIYGVALTCDTIVKVYSDDVVGSNAVVCGNAKVCGNAMVYSNAEVFSPNHVLVIGAIGSRNAFTTFYRGKNRQIMVKCGCFNGTLDEFLEKVEKTHGKNRHAVVYRAAAVIARLQIDLSAVAAEKTLE